MFRVWLSFISTTIVDNGLLYCSFFLFSGYFNFFSIFQQHHCHNKYAKHHEIDAMIIDLNFGFIEHTRTKNCNATY